MQKSLIIKLFLIGLVCLLFMIGLHLVGDLVYEREQNQQAVVDEIKQTQVANQQVMTPFIVLDGADTQSRYTQFIFAKQSTIAGDVDVRTDKYSRGIYQATDYHAQLHIQQSYQLPTSINIANSAAIKVKQQNTQADNSIRASLIIPVSDLRGVTLPQIEINGRTYQATFHDDGQYQHIKSLANQHFLQVPLGNLNQLNELTQVKFSLDVLGIESLGFVPIGEHHKLQLNSNWRDPKFHGDGLPNDKSIDSSGFRTTWQNDFLAQSNANTLRANTEYAFSVLGTEFINVNNPYIQTERTIKYALILLMISFGTFFLFEVLKNLRIHPVQYLLVACSLLAFYMLLLPIAEYLPFWQAYIIAASACMMLIGWYACYLLASWRRATGFSVILGTLYAGFYFILSANEMNLLIGAIFCFVLLAIVMFITRHIDWYSVGEDVIQKTQKIHQNKTSTNIETGAES